MTAPTSGDESNPGRNRWGPELWKGEELNVGHIKRNETIQTNT